METPNSHLFKPKADLAPACLELGKDTLNDWPQRKYIFSNIFLGKY